MCPGQGTRDGKGGLLGKGGPTHDRRAAVWSLRSTVRNSRSTCACERFALQSHGQWSEVRAALGFTQDSRGPGPVTVAHSAPCTHKLPDPGEVAQKPGVSF